ncbi:MAG: UvrD-helicase domain-containing protein [Myxococcales bacterium]|nr:UvrD-helicase domain-containing protein [Myxococcales bacterium]
MTAFAFERNTVLVASAGTGKTHTLVGVLVHVLLGEHADGEPVSPARVVATTFSRKAAHEIRERLRSELTRLVGEPESSLYFSAIADTRRALGRPPPSPSEISKKARRASARVSDVTIGTLHGFCLGLLRSFGVEAGLPYGVEVADEAEVRARDASAIVRAVERFAADGHADFVRELVGRSSGLDGLVTRLRQHFEATSELGIRAGSLVTSDDDRRLVERRFDDLHRRVHAVASLPRYEQAAGAFLSAINAKNDVPFEVVEAALVALAKVKRASNGPPADVALQELIETLPKVSDSKATRLLRLFATYELRETFGPRQDALRGLLVACEEELSAERERAPGLGFGEVLGRVARLLASRDDVAREVGKRFDVLLVDEFQDTSAIQKRIVELVWAEPSAHGLVPAVGLRDVRPKGLFVVGDRKQSIYGFRGADVSVFAELCIGLAGERAREKLRVPGGLVYAPEPPRASFFPLRTNRRSRPEILAFVNAFSARAFVPQEATPELFDIEYSAEVEDLEAPEGAATEPARERVVWVKPPFRQRTGKKPTVTTRRDEARAITRIVMELVSGARAANLGAGRAATYKDCAVLALTNEMLDEMAYALAEADVPYVLAGKSFYKAREVLDTAALLSLLVDPSDRLAALTVLRGPFAAVSDATLLALSEEGRGLLPISPSMFEGPRAHLAVDEAELARVREVVEVVERLSPLLSRVGPGPALRAACEALRLEEVLAALPRGRARVANVRKTLALADAETRAEDFVRRIVSRGQGTDDEGEASTFSDEDDAVRLLTVHASKGLDFPIVFFPQCGAIVNDASRTGPFAVDLSGGGEPRLGMRIAHPSGIVIESPTMERARLVAVRRERAERRRLLYVALTRASHMMFLVGQRRAKESGEVSKSAETALATVLAAMESSEATRALFGVVELSEVVPPEPREKTASGPAAAHEPSALERRIVPSFRVLPIAPTSLQDFHVCPRRFELVHLLGLPEHVTARPGAHAASGPLEEATGAEKTTVSAAADEGTRMHKVLERLSADALGRLSPEATSEAVAEGLTREGYPEDHPRHEVLRKRITRFATGPWLREVMSRGAEARRELSFAVEVPIGEDRRVLLRGAMDLVVVAGDEVHVVDYKRARGPGLEPYAFQLELYVLAARTLFPSARRVRAGVAFLGGDPETPLWLPDVDHEVSERRVRDAATGLSEARATGRFPRASRAVCDAIHCGFVGRCYPKAREHADE